MTIHEALKQEYRSTLAMLRQAIASCPDDLWLDDRPTNRYWHVAYHALFYTHLYMQRREEDFKPWLKAREDFQFFGPVPYPPHHTPAYEPPYTRDELVEYADLIVAQIDATVDRIDLDAAGCGFWWYDMAKLPHQMMNLRHAQHHAGQLAERLREHAGIATDWRG